MPGWQDLCHSLENEDVIWGKGLVCPFADGVIVVLYVGNSCGLQNGKATYRGCEMWDV